MTRRALPDVSRTLASDTRPKGEPVVTAIWLTVSILTLLLGLSLPYLGAIDSPLMADVVPAVAFLYAFAMAATCAYNRLRYGRVWLNQLPVPRPRRSRGGRRHPSARRTKAPLAVMIG